jgi:hypothetical protein
VIKKVVDILKGGKGSGNFGHEGRPGIRGGSGEGNTTDAQELAANRSADKRRVDDAISDTVDNIAELRELPRTSFEEGYAYSPSQFESVTSMKMWTSPLTILREEGIKAPPKIKQLLRRACIETRVGGKLHDKINTDAPRDKQKAQFAQAKKHYDKAIGFALKAKDALKAFKVSI